MGAIGRRLVPALVVAACFMASAANAQDRDTVALLRSAAEALTNREADSFLGLFDKKMPGYASLREDVEGLLANADVSSSIDVVTNEGTATARELTLDWLIRVDRDAPHRETVICKIELQGKRWRIVSMQPLTLFHTSRVDSGR